MIGLCTLSERRGNNEKRGIIIIIIIIIIILRRMRMKIMIIMIKMPMIVVVEMKEVDVVEMEKVDVVTVYMTALASKRIMMSKVLLVNVTRQIATHTKCRPTKHQSPLVRVEICS